MWTVTKPGSRTYIILSILTAYVCTSPILPSIAGESVLFEYQLQEGSVFSYNFRVATEMNRMELVFDGEWTQVVSEKRDTGACLLQEMTTSKLVQGPKMLEEASAAISGGIALSAREMQRDGSSRWEYQSFPWIPAIYLRIPAMELPAGTVQIGKSWHSQWDDLGCTLTLKFVGFKDVMGYRCAEIDVSNPGDNVMQVSGSLFFALREGFWVKWDLVVREGPPSKLTVQLIEAGKLPTEELQRERAAWYEMIKGEEYLRVREPQKAKEIWEKLLASYPDSRWCKGVENFMGLAENPEDRRGRMIPFVWLRWGDHVRSVAFSPDGRLLAICADFSPVILWDATTRKRIDSFQDRGSSAVFSPDGKLIAYAYDKTVKLWNIAERENIATLNTGDVTSLAFHPDGGSLASGSGDGTVKLWDVAAQKEIASLSGHGDMVRMVAFHPDGKLLASGSKDGTIKIWDFTERKEAYTLQVDSETRAPQSIPRTERYRELLMSIWSVTFSPDGEFIAATAGDNVIAVWRVGSWEEVAIFDHPEVVSVAFSPNSKVLASCSDSWTMVLWDIETRQPLAVNSRGQGEYIGTVAFSPDGKILASGSEYGLKLWALYPAVGEGYQSGVQGYGSQMIVNPDRRIFPSQRSEETEWATVPQDPNEIAEIEIIIDNFVEGYNRGDIDMLMSSVSPDYSGHGGTYSGLKESLESAFAERKAESAKCEEYETRLELQDVKVKLKDKGATATSIYEKTIEAIPGGIVTNSSTLIFELSRTTGHWKIIRMTGMIVW